MDNCSKKEVVDLIFTYGGNKDPKVKQWVLDQILHTLLDDDEYSIFVYDFSEVEEEPFNEAWSKGKAPC